MPALKIDIESLIPHRDRIKLINEVLEITPESAVTGATVSSSWPLCDGQSVNSLVLVETVAQTAALIEGHKRGKEGKAGVKGWLVGIKNATFYVERVDLNTKLVISVKSMYSFDQYGVVEGIVKEDENIIAAIVLQALRLNNDGN
jgi:predicted hotdog family 3-hydroxylacyl-ACP dehydratase